MNRDLLFEWLYLQSKKPYERFFKQNTPWDIPLNSLLEYPVESLGYHLGAFLLKHNFQPQAKFENHDIFHVLIGLGISVPEEITMQWYLLGNGKRSIYGLSVIGLGLVIYPDKFLLFHKGYRLGKVSHAFHQLNFLNLLTQPLQKIQNAFSIKSYYDDKN